MQQPAGFEVIRLDRSQEPWRGTFPGLGEVRVTADGSVDVTVISPEPGDPDSVAMRDAALRHGWGEALSWTRRGYGLLAGGAVTPDPSRGCLLLTGDHHEFGRFIPELCARQWMFLSDRYTPAQWHGGRLVAYPRDAPILMSQRRADKVGWRGEAVRGDTDSLAVDVSRVAGTAVVVGVVSLNRGRNGDPLFEVLTGHRRFEAAASLRLGGALAADAPDSAAESDSWSDAAAESPVDPVVRDSPTPDMTEQLRMAALPFASLNSAGELARMADEAQELVQWWDSLIEGAA